MRVLVRALVACIAVIVTAVHGAPLSMAHGAAGASALAGYAHGRTVVVKGGSATVSGSLNTPVAVTSDDYVVMLHLTGAQAAAVYGQARYNARRTFAGVAFADVTMWYAPAPGIWRQIDVDADQSTFGPWSHRNITLWFRLQAPLGAAPATDNHYMLRWGNRNPNVMRSWDNIYPFQDNFSGTALNPGKWTLSGHVYPAVSNGILTLTAYNFGDSGLFSTAAFGPGYQVSMRAIQPAIPGGGHSTSLREWEGAGATSNLIAVGYDSATAPASYSLGAHDATSNSWTHALLPVAANNSYHIFALARDSFGVAHAWVDGASAMVPDYNMLGAFNVMLDGDNAADGMSTTMSVDWVKVRPWIAQEPHAALT